MEVHSLFPHLVFTFQSSSVIPLLVVMVLLVMSAFASGSEVAFFSLTPQNIQDIKEKATAKIGVNATTLQLLNYPEKLLATILIANNFINVGIVILSGFIMDSIIQFNGGSEAIKFLIQVGGLSFILLLFGEILPKVYASNNAHSFALLMSAPLVFCQKALKPLVNLLVRSTNVVNRKLSKRNGRNLSMDDLSHALELTSVVKDDDKEILEGIIKFGNIAVADIMQSRLDIVELDISQSFKEVLDVIVANGYSRIPVCSKNVDDIKGILYIKDLLPHINKGNFFRWQTLIRPPYFVPETMMINDLLKEFQTSKIHMAVVIDEYGGTSGICTLEDILGEIVGDICEDSEDNKIQFEQIDEFNFIFDAKTAISDFIKYTHSSEEIWEDIQENADSLAGMVLEIKGEFPCTNEQITYKEYIITVLEVDDRRIKKLQITCPQIKKKK